MEEKELKHYIKQCIREALKDEILPLIKDCHDLVLKDLSDSNGRIDRVNAAVTELGVAARSITDVSTRIFDTLQKSQENNSDLIAANIGLAKTFEEVRSDYHENLNGYKEELHNAKNMYHRASEAYIRLAESGKNSGTPGNTTEVNIDSRNKA